MICSSQIIFCYENNLHNAINSINGSYNGCEKGVRKTRQSTSACDDLWPFKQDNNNEIWGLIAIPFPDSQKNVLKLVLSVAAQLPSVSLVI